MSLGWFRLGAAALVVVGVGHLSIYFVRTMRRSARHLELDAVMRCHVLRLLGRAVMGILFVAVGLLDLLISGTPGIVVPPSLGWLNLSTSLVTLAIAIRGFPPPPIAFLSVATMYFGRGLAR